MQDMRRPGCIQLLDNQEWNIYEDNFHEAAGNPAYEDINCIDFNPLHPDTLLHAEEPDSISLPMADSSSITATTTVRWFPYSVLTRTMWWCRVSRSTARANSGSSTA